MRGFARGSVLFVFVLACGSSGQPYGSPCEKDADCQDGACHGAPGDSTGAVPTCTRVCSQDSECPAGSSCATFADGQRRCATACEPPYSYTDGFVCVAGEQVACELAGAAWTCDNCPCQAGQFCDGFHGPSTCQPLRRVGESCLDNRDCESANCSTPAGLDPEHPGVCYVPRDTACTDASCGSCDVSPAGHFCAQACHADNDCAPGEQCLGSHETGEYFCRPPCTTVAGQECAPGWRCLLPSGANARWACLPPTECTVGDACTTCTPLAGQSYAICAETCIGFNLCPFNLQCRMYGSGDYRCVP